MRLDEVREGMHCRFNVRDGIFHPADGKVVVVEAVVKRRAYPVNIGYEDAGRKEISAASPTELTPV